MSLSFDWEAASLTSAARIVTALLRGATRYDARMRFIFLPWAVLAIPLSFAACSGGDDNAIADGGNSDSTTGNSDSASGGDTGSHADANDGGSLVDTGSQTDTGTRPDASDGAANDAGDAGATSTLKIEDYLAWCSVSVNDGGASAASLRTLTVPTGTVVTLSGDTASAVAFVWGYWVGTSGDTTATHDQSKITTVTMSGDKTVQACCPLSSSPSTPCPPPN